MSDRLSEIEGRLAEPPAAQAEFIQFGREWRAVYGPETPFPPNYGIAVQMASDLSRARADLADLVKFARAVQDIAASLALHGAMRVQVPSSDVGQRLAGALSHLEQP